MSVILVSPRAWVPLWLWHALRPSTLPIRGLSKLVCRVTRIEGPEEQANGRKLADDDAVTKKLRTRNSPGGAV